VSDRDRDPDPNRDRDLDLDLPLSPALSPLRGARGDDTPCPTPTPTSTPISEFRLVGHVRLP